MEMNYALLNYGNAIARVDALVVAPVVEVTHLTIIRRVGGIRDLSTDKKRQRSFAYQLSARLACLYGVSW